MQSRLDPVIIEQREHIDELERLLVAAAIAIQHSTEAQHMLLLKATIHPQTFLEGARAALGRKYPE